MTMQAMPMMLPVMPAQAAGVPGGKPMIGGKANADGDLFGQLLAETGLAAEELQAALATLPASCRQKFDLAVSAETKVPIDPLLEQAEPVEDELLALLVAPETAPEVPVATVTETAAPDLTLALPQPTDTAEIVAAPSLEAAPVVPEVPAELVLAAVQAHPETAPEQMQAQAKANANAKVEAAPVMAAVLAETVPVKDGETKAKTVPGHLKQEMDQRFARLLQPQSQEHAQARPLRGEKLPQPTAVAVAPEASAAMPQPAAVANPAAQLLAELHQAEGHCNPSGDQLQPTLQGISPQPQATAPQPMAVEPMLNLASGRQLPEAALVQQVVTHLSGSSDGETGKMVLRLKPAELGELKIELVMEGDRLKAHLHAQSQQVQEVLERNLPQLRDALQQKGLQMDDFRVSVDSGRNQGQGFQQQGQEAAPRAWAGRGYRVDGSFGDLEEMAIPLHRAQHPGGISVHV